MISGVMLRLDQEGVLVKEKSEEKHGLNIQGALGVLLLRIPLCSAGEFSRVRLGSWEEEG